MSNGLTNIEELITSAVKIQIKEGTIDQDFTGNVDFSVFVNKGGVRTINQRTYRDTKKSKIK